jgi:hypothetical protein
VPDDAIRWTVRLFAALGVLIGGFAPLALGDYLVELTLQRGSRSEKVLVAVRIVP